MPLLVWCQRQWGFGDCLSRQQEILLVSLPSCSALAEEHDLSLLPWRRLFDPGPWGWSWWRFWSTLKGRRSPGRWSPQNRRTQFVSRYQPGSPLALVTCVALASLLARLLHPVVSAHLPLLSLSLLWKIPDFFSWLEQMSGLVTNQFFPSFPH